MQSMLIIAYFCTFHYIYILFFFLYTRKKIRVKWEQVEQQVSFDGNNVCIYLRQ